MRAGFVNRPLTTVAFNGRSGLARVLRNASELAVLVSPAGHLVQIDRKRRIFGASSGSVVRADVPILGPALTFAGSTTQRIEFTSRPTTIGTKYTLAGIATWNSGGANSFPQILGTSSINSGVRLSSSLGAGGDIQLVKGGVITLTALSITSGVPTFIVATHDETSGAYTILAKRLDDGTITTATQTQSSASVAGDGNWAFGNARLDFSGAWNGHCAMGYIGSCFLDEGQMREWANDPWMMFRLPMEDNSLAFTPPAAGGTAEINGASIIGAFTSSGAAKAIAQLAGASAMGAFTSVGVASNVSDPTGSKGGQIPTVARRRRGR